MLMIVLSFKAQPIQSKSKKQINKKENVRIEMGNKLGPVRQAQQIQAEVHTYILGAIVNYCVLYVNYN